MAGYDDLTDKQKRAFDLAVAPKEGATNIMGYAGTGKTTTMREVALALGKSCVVLAPTNKAANNLKEKGIKKSRTIHSLLYQPIEVEDYRKDANGNIEYHKDRDGEYLIDDAGDKIPVVAEKRLEFMLRGTDSDGERVLPEIALIDEASMISDDVYNDLLMTFPRVVFFGDGFQLPPVKSKDVFAKSEPDVFLDEVHRVALENPIIKYATDIRMGNEPPVESIACHEIRHCAANNTKLYSAIVANDVQAISYRNRTRHDVNEAIRKERGFQFGMLNNGESVVCLQNVKQRKEIDGRQVEELIYYNGQIVTINGDYSPSRNHFTAMPVAVNEGPRVFMWPFWNPGFFGIKDDYQKWNNELDRRKASNMEKPVYGKDFDYAYCLTAHKAQGSEFRNVCVFDERPSLRNVGHQEKQRWYYTAITRAKERLLIVK